MSDALSAEGRIEAERRIESFLNDEYVGGALTRMERQYYEEFLAADTSELRVRAWAKARVLKDLEREMKAISDAGKGERILAVRQEKLEQLKKDKPWL